MEWEEYFRNLLREIERRAVMKERKERDINEEKERSEIKRL